MWFKKEEVCRKSVCGVFLGVCAGSRLVFFVTLFFCGCRRLRAGSSQQTKGKHFTSSSLRLNPSFFLVVGYHTHTEMATIFVSLISYRDSEAQWTIEDLFSQARFPDRIFIGYCGQYDLARDTHCFVKACSRPAQVRSMMLDYHQARGPCFARALAQAFWEGEDYFLQIDSHMRFVKDWDEKLIAMLAQCKSEKPVLTMYPPEYKQGSPVPKNSMPNLLCAKHFDKDGMLRIRGRRLKVQPKAPIPSLFWAAGFFFTHF